MNRKDDINIKFHIAYENPLFKSLDDKIGNIIFNYCFNVCYINQISYDLEAFIKDDLLNEMV